MPLAGGMMQGYQCGQLWGAALAAGAQAYQLLGPGAQAETAAIMAAQRLVESFRAQNKQINCLEITEVDMKHVKTRQMVKLFLKGGPIRCFSMAGRYAPAAFKEINAALSEKTFETPPRPVSCAATLAQKMGLSEMHMAMLAGFAGGIGLCGGACGALGAALWISGLKDSQAGAKFEMQNPRTLALIDKFVESSGYEFECAKIVGRKFADVDEHAGYLREGGCSKIIEALADQGS
jgi:Putative redox-active protein (C_GCAxxG_C_C)